MIEKKNSHDMIREFINVICNNNVTNEKDLLDLIVKINQKLCPQSCTNKHPIQINNINIPVY
jgi:hypothetical protein